MATVGVRTESQWTQRFAAIVFFCLLLTQPLSAAEIKVRTAVVTLQEDHTEIALESRAEIRFILFTLSYPERLILDLEGVALGAALSSIERSLGADHPYIHRIRVGQQAGRGVRLEFDLKHAVEPSITTLPADDRGKYRLVLGIYPLGRPTSAGRAAPLVNPANGPAATASATRDTKLSDASGEWTEALLAVRINDAAQGEATLFLRDRDGHLLARGADLQQWRLPLPGSRPFVQAGVNYYALDELGELTYRIDEPNQILLVNAPAGLFAATVWDSRKTGFVEPSVPAPGAFLNYDVFAAHTVGDTRINGLLEVGVFNRWGVGIGNFLAQETHDGMRYIRLETTWTRDMPAQLSSLRLGDAITSTSAWSNAVRFGGAQWATNFATQPGFISFPLPGLSGEARLPSTVDLYVNGALRLSREVPVGPFSILDLPIITGQGEARLVVRDALGREHVISQPYYASTRLLQDGLHDYSYEVGFVRENFALESNDYGRLVAVGTHRYGLSDRLTGELHGEFLRDQQTLGVSAAWLWPGTGILSGAFAASRGNRGSGGLLALGFDRQSARFSFGANVEFATAHFVQLGLQRGELAAGRTIHAFASAALGNHGSLGLGYTQQDFRDRADVELISVNYGVSVGAHYYLTLSAIRFLGDDPEMLISANLTRPFGTRSSASAGFNHQNGDQRSVLQLQRNAPAGSGWGYRLQADLGDNARFAAAVNAQTDFGTYSLEAAHYADDSAYRAGMSGGLAWLNGGAYASRRITESFALIQVSDFPDVGIYADNQLVARTDAVGNALLPRLRPYQKNPIRIEQGDLPLDAHVDTLQIEVVPYFRSGTTLRFPIRRSRGALIIVLLDDGSPMPVGALAQLEGTSLSFPTGLRGEVYLTDLEAVNRVRMIWREQSCEFAVAFPPTNDPLPVLGAFTCNGITP